MPAPDSLSSASGGSDPRRSEPSDAEMFGGNPQPSLPHLPAQLMKLAKQAKWEMIESLLTRLESDPSLRGAALLRALNTPVTPGGPGFLAALAFFGAPPNLIIKGVDCGAVLSSECSVTTKNGSRISKCRPLHLAFSQGHFSTAQALLEVGHTASCRNSEGDTPLQHLLKRPPAGSLLSSDAARGAIHAAVRKELLEGAETRILARNVKEAMQAGSWQVAQIIVEEWGKAPLGPDSARLSRTTIANWALYTVVKGGTPDFLGALVQLSRSHTAYGDPQFSVAGFEDLLLHRLPSFSDAIPKTNDSAAWSRFAQTLDLLERAAPILPSHIVEELVNVVDRDGKAPFPVDELAALGYEERTTIDPPSLIHILLRARAPLPAVETVIKLGANLEYKALVKGPRDFFYDGTALHTSALYCEEGHIRLILENKVDPSTANSQGDIPLQTYFGDRRGNDLDVEPNTVVLFIRAGSPTSHTNNRKMSLGHQYLDGHRFDLLIELAEEHNRARRDPKSSSAEEAPKPFPPNQSGPILKEGRLVDGSPDEVKREVERLMQHAEGWRDHYLGDYAVSISMLSPRERVFSTNAGRQLVESIADALESSLQPLEPDLSDSSYEDPSSFFEDLSDNEEWSEGGGVGVLDEGEDQEPSIFDSGYLEDFDPVNDGESDSVFGLIEDDTDLEVRPTSSPAPKFPSIDASLLDAIPGAESPGLDPAILDDPGALEDAFFEMLNEIEGALLPVPPAPPPTPSVAGALLAIPPDLPSPSELMELIGAHSEHSPSQYFSAIDALYGAGEYHSAYVLLKAIEEVPGARETPLMSPTMALNVLLYRLPPGTANLLGSLVDLNPPHFSRRGIAIVCERQVRHCYPFNSHLLGPKELF